MIVKQNWGDKCLSRVSERESKHMYERGTERRAASVVALSLWCLHSRRGGVLLPALALQCQRGLVAISERMNGFLQSLSKKLFMEFINLLRAE